MFGRRVFGAAGEQHSKARVGEVIARPHFKDMQA